RVARVAWLDERWEEEALVDPPHVGAEREAIGEIEPGRRVDGPVRNARRGAATQAGLPGALGGADRIDRDQVVHVAGQDIYAQGVVRTDRLEIVELEIDPARDQLVHVLDRVGHADDVVAGVAHDQRAAQGIAVDAAVDDVLLAESADGVVDLDVEIVGRGPEAAEEPTGRLQHYADGEGVGAFGRQIGVRAANDFDDHLLAAVAGIGEDSRASGDRPEQLGDVGGADVARSRDAEPDRVDRRPNAAHLPGGHVDA